MDLSHFIMLNNEFLIKDPYLVPYQVPIIIVDIKSAIYMANTFKDIKYTRHISRIMHFVRNGEE